MAIPVEITNTDSWATIASFTVAGVALLGMILTWIIHKRAENKHERDRRKEKYERRLNEIIEWAEDILRGETRARLTAKNSSMIPFVQSRPDASEKDVQYMNNLSLLVELRAEIKDSSFKVIYMTTIAEDTAIKSEVTNTLVDLKDQLESFLAFLGSVLHDDENRQQRLQPESVEMISFFEHKLDLLKKAKALIIATTRSKTSLLKAD